MRDAGEVDGAGPPVLSVAPSSDGEGVGVGAWEGVRFLAAHVLEEEEGQAQSRLPVVEWS